MSPNVPLSFSSSSRPHLGNARSPQSSTHPSSTSSLCGASNVLQPPIVSGNTRSDLNPKPSTTTIPPSTTSTGGFGPETTRSPTPIDIVSTQPAGVDIETAGLWTSLKQDSTVLGLELATEYRDPGVTIPEESVKTGSASEAPPGLPSIPSSDSRTASPSASSATSSRAGPAVHPRSLPASPASLPLPASATLTLLAELYEKQSQSTVATAPPLISISLEEHTPSNNSTSGSSIVAATGVPSGFVDPNPDPIPTTPLQTDSSGGTGNSHSDQVIRDLKPSTLSSSSFGASGAPSLTAHEPLVSAATKPPAEAEPCAEPSQKSSTSTVWGGARLSKLYSELTSTFSRAKKPNQTEARNQLFDTNGTPPSAAPEDSEDQLDTALFLVTPSPAAVSNKSPDSNWTRTSSIGSIHGLLASAFDYLVAVAPSPSASISGLLQPTADPAPTPQSPDPNTHISENTNKEDAQSIESIDRDSTNDAILPSPSKSRSLAPASGAPSSNRPSPVPLAASPSLSFALPGRLHAAYQSIVTPSSTQQPRQPYLAQSSVQPPPPPSSRKEEELEAILQGQQRAGKVSRRNSTNTPPSTHITMRREKYTDYFRDSASPPPLPIPSSSIVSRSTTPATISTTSTVPSRRNTLDSMTASFSSFYSSNTSVAGPPPTSSNRERERESHHRSRDSKDREREREREKAARTERALSPDPYASYGNNPPIPRTTSSPSFADPFAAVRLEDRCRHLEKMVKDLQSKLRSKDQDLKMRDSELRSWETEMRAKDAELRAKDSEVREKEMELRGKVGELRKREVELRDREGELREVEGLLRETEGEVRWRDVELKRLKAREWELEKEVEKAVQSATSRSHSTTPKDLGGRKSMKELMERTKENVENLEKQLKRRASASPIPPASGQPTHSRHNSLDMKANNLAVPGSTGGVNSSNLPLSTSAPSSYPAKGYTASMRQQNASSSSLDSGSASGSSESSRSTRTGNSNQGSPSTSASPSPAPQQQSQQVRPPQLKIPIPITAPTPPSLPIVLPYTEAHAQERSADAFLTRTDSWSGAQVLQAVNDVNSEVVQFAAVVTEMCRFAPREVPSPSPSPNPHSTNGTDDARGNPLKGTKAYADTAARLGGSLTHLLATYDHSNDPILVQLALQACVCVAAKRAWESFCLGLPAKSDGVLGVIYRSLRELEPQPTSSKWRSLTHGHIHAIYPTLASYSAKELAETMLRWTVDILTLAGCVGIDSGGVQTSTEDSLANYGLNNSIKALHTQHTTSLLLPQLLHITTALTRLENVLRQDILSTSFDLVIPECGMAFGKGWMVDFFGYDSGSNPSAPTPNPVAGGGYDGEMTKVLGSVEVGLMCRTRIGIRGGGVTPTLSTPVATGNGLSLVNGSGGSSILGGQGTNMSQQQQAGAGGGMAAVYEERLLLMPKVILESVVDLL